jgi:hypothetical protein
MRLLVVCVLVAFAAPTYAADKDGDKAKEVVEAFLKGLKDIDAVMKTVDVPFAYVYPFSKPEMFEKRDELKKFMADLIETANQVKLKGTRVGKVYYITGIPKFLKEEVLQDETSLFFKEAEKHVGKDGRMVTLILDTKEAAGEFPLLVRFKDGKALIASFPK